MSSAEISAWHQPKDHFEEELDPLSRFIVIRQRYLLEIRNRKELPETFVLKGRHLLNGDRDNPVQDLIYILNDKLVLSNLTTEQLEFVSAQLVEALERFQQFEQAYEQYSL